MEYGEDAQCSAISQRAYQSQLRTQGAIGVNLAQQETELASLLGTLQQQASEIRGITASILQRVAPQAQDEACEKQCFNSGYVGRAEEIRSTLSEAIRLLGTLSKLA